VIVINAGLAVLALVAVLSRAATPYVLGLTVLLLAGAYLAIERRSPMQPHRENELLRTRVN
jgi:hypothetical protein